MVNLSKPCYKTAFLLHQAAGPTVKLAVNKDGVTPYQVDIVFVLVFKTLFIVDVCMESTSFLVILRFKISTILYIPSACLT